MLTDDGPDINSCSRILLSMRKCKLPADKALWVTIGMALPADRSIMRVFEHLDLVIDGLVHSSANQIKIKT